MRQKMRELQGKKTSGRTEKPKKIERKRDKERKKKRKNKERRTEREEEGKEVTGLGTSRRVGGAASSSNYYNMRRFLEEVPTITTKSPVPEGGRACALHAGRSQP